MSTKTKTCRRCHLELPVAQFYQHPKTADRLQPQCKSCRKLIQREYARKRGVREKVRREDVADGLKQCLHCKAILPVEKFSPCARGFLGVTAYCRPCLSKRAMRDKAAHAERARRWRRDNEAWRTWHAAFMTKRRRLIVATSDGTVTAKVIRGLYATECCHYCGRQTPQDERTMDHKTPLSRGGRHTVGNLVMACLPCNSSKQDKTEEEFNGLRMSR